MNKFSTEQRLQNFIKQNIYFQKRQLNCNFLVSDVSKGKRRAKTNFEAGVQFCEGVFFAWTGNYVVNENLVKHRPHYADQIGQIESPEIKIPYRDGDFGTLYAVVKDGQAFFCHSVSAIGVLDSIQFDSRSPHLKAVVFRKFAFPRSSCVCSLMIPAFSSPFIYIRRNQSRSNPQMCVLRRIADIANAAVKRARPSPHSSPSITHHLLSDTDLANLTNAVALVTPDHLSVHSHDYVGYLPSPENLIGYVSVAAEQNFTMAVFIMPPGAEIPLHDHAHMYVVTNVLWGTLEIHEYEPLIEDNPSGTDTIPAKKQPISVLNAGNVRSLTPSRGNIHSFRSRDWTAVFDVLVPPYDSHAGRNCNYYTPLREHTLSAASGDDNQFILKRSPSPDTYRTTSLEYEGTPLNP